MSSEAAIPQYLQASGIPFTPYGPIAGAPGANGTVVTHMGFQVNLQVQNGQLLLAQLVVGFIPQTNVAPLLRQLLVINASMVGVYFCVVENAVILRASRNLLGLDQEELKSLLDHICSYTVQYGVGVKNTFQLLDTPA
jgi:hypothetical protein